MLSFIKLFQFPMMTSDGLEYGLENCMAETQEVMPQKGSIHCIHWRHQLQPKIEQILQIFFQIM